jgi:acyl dehydratase
LETTGNIGGPTISVGAIIGPGPWLVVDQEMIDGFSQHTRDPDPFHIDPDWASKHSPFGTTIAFGFLTMSLLTHLLQAAQGEMARDLAADPNTHGHYLNYGFDRLRLVSPVPVGSRIRGTFTVIKSEADARGRHMVVFDTAVEVEGEAKPALIAEWLALWSPVDG